MPRPFLASPAIAFILLFVAAEPLVGQESITVYRFQNGLMQTDLGRGNVVNGHSGLMREAIVVVDSRLLFSFREAASECRTCAVAVRTQWDRSRMDYEYVAEYHATPSEDVEAVEIRFILFDIWGDYIKTLSATEVASMPAGIERWWTQKWNLWSENEVATYYASIAYIARVRTKGGEVILADTEAVLAEARKFSSDFEESDFEPTDTLPLTQS